jgi:Rieske Fe-S protein
MLPSLRDALRPSTSRRGESERGRDDAETPHDGQVDGDRPDEEADPRRRGVVVGGALVLGTVAAAGVAGLAGRSRREDAGASPDRGTSGGASAGTVLASVTDLESTGSVVFDDPEIGSSVLVALGGGQVAAFSRRCTHSGCSCDYDEATRLIRCPCHASTFDPADGARVLSGPAPRPLPAVPVVVDESTGEVRRA